MYATNISNHRQRNNHESVHGWVTELNNFLGFWSCRSQLLGASLQDSNNNGCQILLISIFLHVRLKWHIYTFHFFQMKKNSHSIYVTIYTFLLWNIVMMFSFLLQVRISSNYMKECLWVPFAIETVFFIYLLVSIYTLRNIQFILWSYLYKTS